MPEPNIANDASDLFDANGLNNLPDRIANPEDSNVYRNIVAGMNIRLLRSRTTDICIIFSINTESTLQIGKTGMETIHPASDKNRKKENY